MGKVQIITKEQKKVFDEVVDSDYFRENFYFTGWTALSYF